MDEKLAPTLRTTDVMISHTHTHTHTHTDKKPDTAPMELQSRYTHTESKGATNHMQINGYPKGSVFRQKLQTKTRVTVINWWRKR